MTSFITFLDLQFTGFQFVQSREITLFAC